MSNSGESKIGPLFIGLAIGFNLGNLFGSISKENQKDDFLKRIAIVQEHHEQLEQQLIPTYQGMGHLVLNDETDTFEFHINSRSYPNQDCKGHYKVQDDKAVAVGNIACTQEHEVGTR